MLKELTITIFLCSIPVLAIYWRSIRERVNSKYINDKMGRVVLNRHNNSITFTARTGSFSIAFFTIKDIKKISQIVNGDNGDEEVKGYLVHGSQLSEHIRIGCQRILIEDANKIIKFLKQRGYDVDYIHNRH